MNNKKSVFIILLLALITGSCRQKAKVATTSVSEADTVLQADTVAQMESVPQMDTVPASPAYSGFYTFGDSNEGAAEGTVSIYQENDTSVLFYLYVSKGAPSYNCGEIDGRFTVKDRKGTFRKRFPYSDTDCTLHFEFKDSAVAISQESMDCQCGFGGGVYVDDTFRRTASEAPQYYTTLSNDTVLFSQLQAQLQGMEMLQEFYTRYITVNCQTKPDSIYLEGIKKNFISDKLIAKIDSALLNYDVLMNAQDYDMEWIESLEIAPVHERPNTFDVCYSNKGKNKTCMTVILVECWGKYLIDNIDGLDEIIASGYGRMDEGIQ